MAEMADILEDGIGGRDDRLPAFPFFFFNHLPDPSLHLYTLHGGRCTFYVFYVLQARRYGVSLHFISLPAGLGLEISVSAWISVHLHA